MTLDETYSYPGKLGASEANGVGKSGRRTDLDQSYLPPSPASSNSRTGRRYALATELVFTEGNDQYNSSSMPIYQVGARAGREALNDPAPLPRARRTLLYPCPLLSHQGSAHSSATLVRDVQADLGSRRWRV